MTAPEEKPERDADGGLVIGAGVLYLPPGTTQEPCPFPCAICRRKGLQ
jgi:hypothetical protein